MPSPWLEIGQFRRNMKRTTPKESASVSKTPGYSGLPDEWAWLASSATSSMSCQAFLFSFVLIFLLLFNYSCPHFPPIALPSHTPPHSILPRYPCPWVFYTCPLTLPLPSVPVIPSHVPSPGPGHCHYQIVLYVRVSGSVLLTCLFC